MGRFGIGVRVRDADGDLAEIIGKPEKGFRELRIHGGKYDGLTYWALKSDLETIGLQLELGKTYVDRDGDEHGPLIVNTVESPYKDSHPFAELGSHMSWRPDGGFLPTGEDSWDLVAEVVRPAETEPVVAVEREFKVGDRVKVLSNVNGAGEVMSAFYAVGEVCTITAPAGPEDAWVLDGRARFLWGKDIAPFTIEAGKFYRTRDGRKVGPARTSGTFSVTSDQHGNIAGAYIPEQGSYTTSGIWLAGDSHSIHDIVAEWVEPAAAEWNDFDHWDAPPTIVVEDATDPVPAKPHPKFKVGDRVWPKNADLSHVRSHWARCFAGQRGTDDAMYVTEVNIGRFGRGDDEIGISNKPGSYTVVYWNSRRFELAPDLPVGTPVTIFGQVSGINGQNRSVMFDAGNSNCVSYDLPATALRAA